MVQLNIHVPFILQLLNGVQSGSGIGGSSGGIGGLGVVSLHVGPV